MDWRAEVLRRLARRFRIGDDVLRHLSTFQRLGERLELEPPSEMLPVGARTVVRALRTRSAAQIRPDWLWPYWLERQLDPSSPAFVPRGHLPFAANVTHRNWTAVGNVDSAWEAIVDPVGLLTPGHDTWSVDWWVRSPQRWHLPSREVALAQELVGARPVVQTTMPIADGEARQRVYALRTSDGEYVAMEVANHSPHPVDVAFAVRPYNPEGLAVVEDVLIGPERVTVDGHLGVLLPRRPALAVASTYHGGDSLHELRSGRGGDALPRRVRDPAGLAQAAVVYAVAPGQRGHVLVALPPRDQAPRRVAVHDRTADVTAVLRGWDAALDRGLRVQLPDPRLQTAVDANRAFLLLLHDPGDITAGPATYHRFWFRDAAYQVGALDRWGLHAEAADVLLTYPDRQRSDGFFFSQWREWDANGAAIYAIAEHHRLTGDDDLLVALAPAVRAGVNWIDRTRRGRGMRARRARRRAPVRPDAPPVRGLLPAGVSAEHLGPFDYYYWDDFWALRGLLDGAAIARALGEAAPARRIEAAAASFREDILASVRWAAARAGDGTASFIPAGPYRSIDAGMIGSLVACTPLGLLADDDPLIEGTLQLLRDRFCAEDAFYQQISHTGLGTYLTLQLAFVELERGDQRAWRRLRWLLDAATPTFTWPEAIHPQLGGGCMGDGHHGWAAADFLNFVRAVLVRELSDGATAVLSLLPGEWRGEGVEVRHAPVHGGRLTYSVTWSGERPVLAWEWEDGGGVLRAPGLDPGWSSDQRAGEAVLAPVS
ncbi:MAG TPA: hypothetical protein VHF25_16790 [Nitriliruptorales bacterium]|nr:hypothetical protein [Nitriliruptorales bacterium]